MKTLQLHLFATLSLVGLLLLMGCGEADLSSALEEETSAVSISAAKTSSSGMVCVPPPPGMVSWWPGDGNTDDIVGGNHGTLQNGATFGAGMVGQAFSFDGFNDYIALPNLGSSVSGNSARTVDAWIKPEDLSRQMIFTYNAINQDGRSFDFEVGITPGEIALHDFGCQYQTTTGILPANQFTHVAVTYDGTTVPGGLRLYINGVSQPHTPIGSPQRCQASPLNSGDNGYQIGSRVEHGSRQLFFEGIIDEVEIFDRALTAEEIEAIYNAGSAGKCKTTEVEIDIKPGSDPNCINLGSDGVVPVAVLGSVTFDVSTVDQTTLELEGSNARVRGRSGRIGSFDDVNGDGFTDLVVQFPTADLDLTESDTEAALTGTLLDGTTIGGVDDICVVPPPVEPFVPLCGAGHTQGMVSYWQAESDYSDAYNGNDGTLHQDVSFVAGQVGQAFVFNGSSSYIDLGSSSNMKPGTGDVSFLAWYNSADATIEFNAIMGDKRVGYLGSQDGWLVGVHDNGDRFWVMLENAGQYKAYYLPQDIADGSWYFLSFTWANSSDNLKLFINGVEMPPDKRFGDANLAGLSIASTANTFIGRRPGPIGNSPQHLNGTLDEVALYDRVLTPREIEQHYVNGRDAQPYCVVPSTAASQ